MAPVRARLAVAPLLLLTLAFPEAEGDLWHDFPTLDAGTIAGAVAGHSPAELTQAIQDHAAKANPAAMAGQLKNALNGSSVEGAAGFVRNAAERATGSGGQDKIAHAMQVAGEALKGGADTVVNTTATDVQHAIEDIHTPAMATPAIGQVAEALRKANTENIAGVLRGVTPQAAIAVNETSLHLAHTLQAHVPRAVALLNSTAHEVANVLQGRGQPGEHVIISDDPEDMLPKQVPERSLAPLSWVLLLVLTTAAVYLLFQRYKGGGQRGAMLLSDALAGSPQRSVRGPSIQMQAANQESFFTQF